jgi:hypothetical protein
MSGHSEAAPRLVEAQKDLIHAAADATEVDLVAAQAATHADSPHQVDHVRKDHLGVPLSTVLLDRPGRHYEHPASS